MTKRPPLKRPRLFPQLERNLWGSDGEIQATHTSERPSVLAALRQLPPCLKLCSARRYSAVGLLPRSTAKVKSSRDVPIVRSSALSIMVFTAPSWVPALPFDPPDSIPICDFMLEEHYGRHPLGYSNNPFTCGLTGKTYTSLEVRERVDYLARALAKELGWQPNQGSEWDKVIAVFSVNTVSAARQAHAVHGCRCWSPMLMLMLTLESSTHCL